MEPTRVFTIDEVGDRYAITWPEASEGRIEAPNGKRIVTIRFQYRTDRIAPGSRNDALILRMDGRRSHMFPLTPGTTTYDHSLNTPWVQNIDWQTLDPSEPLVALAREKLGLPDVRPRIWVHITYDLMKA